MHLMAAQILQRPPFIQLRRERATMGAKATGAAFHGPVGAAKPEEIEPVQHHGHDEAVEEVLRLVGDVQRVHGPPLELCKVAEGVQQLLDGSEDKRYASGSRRVHLRKGFNSRGNLGLDQQDTNENAHFSCCVWHTEAASM